MDLIKRANLADNSNEPKLLKIADMDVWTRDELLDYIDSVDWFYGYSSRFLFLSTPTKIVRKVAMEAASKNHPGN